MLPVILNSNLRSIENYGGSQIEETGKREAVGIPTYKKTDIAIRIFYQVWAWNDERATVCVNVSIISEW